MDPVRSFSQIVWSCKRNKWHGIIDGKEELAGKNPHMVQVKKAHPAALFHKEMAHIHPTSLPGELNSNLPPTDQWFGPAYKFPSLESAKLHIFFWMGSMILCPLIHKARCLVISKARNPGAAGSPTDDQTSSIFYADRVARSLPYCSQAGMNTRGSYPGISTTSHLAMIYSAAGCWEKYTWTKQVFVHMSNCGYGVAARGYDIVSTWWLRDNPPTDRNAETEDIDPDQIWRTKPHRLSLGFQAIKDGLSIDGSETTPVE